MLLRACPSTSSHTRPQLREHDDAFVAVERADSNGWCRIRRRGQEKCTYGVVPPTVADVDVILKGLGAGIITCPVWREGDCGAGAGTVGGAGGGGGAAARARV